jgi:RNA polymerase sigma-70 factor (ECF subfamily)
VSDSKELADWMGAAQRGDQRAYQLLLEAIQPLVFRYARRRLNSDESASDVCQDVLLTLHRARHTYEPGRPFEPWLFAIARTRLIDHLRRERRISRAEVMMDVLPEVAQSGAENTADSVFEVLEKLPDAQREAFAMLKLEGLTTEEAAERAGVSVSALKVRAHRAYKAIRKAFASDDV